MLEGIEQSNIRYSNESEQAVAMPHRYPIFHSCEASTTLARQYYPYNDGSRLSLCAILLVMSQQILPGVGAIGYDF